MKVIAGGLVIYECADWGARPPTHAFAATTPSDSVVHHMDWANRALIADHNEAVQWAFHVARQCQADHMDGNGWSDTGQHFTITRDGIVLEGRHGSLAALLAGHCIRGAHAADADTGADDNDSWGVEHEGTYTTEHMPQAQWNASVRLFGAIGQLCNLDTATIKGHRDTGCQTACPGDWLESVLPEFRQSAHVYKLKLRSM